MPIGQETSAENWGKVLTVLGGCLVPFTAGGVIIAHLLSRHPQQANRLYGFDLIGAGFACVAFIPMTSWLGAPSALLFAGALAAFAGFVLAGPAEARSPPACRRSPASRSTVSRSICCAGLSGTSSAGCTLSIPACASSTTTDATSSVPPGRGLT
jgi:hypothetical protein